MKRSIIAMAIAMGTTQAFGAPAADRYIIKFKDGHGAEVR